MNKKLKKSLLIVLIIVILLSGMLLLYKSNFFQKQERFNISYLPTEFVEKYFEEIGKADSNTEKENMLIVISDNKIKNSYGAKKIIEAPNHQYILQYNSEKQKKSALQQLKKDKKIESVEENDIYTIEEGNYNSWGIEKMALDHAIVSANANTENMQQITVAVIDTGCDITLFNKYYGGKILEFYNVLEQSTTVMTDESGHGTHVAGTIAEGTPNNVKILPIKVSKTGDMYYSDVIAAINYIVYKNNAQVINMSFGGYGYNEALDQAIESAKVKNIISVAAAGNDNTSKKHYPASFDNTISIASVDSDLNKSTFSNYGAEISFAAPGTNIRSIMGKDTYISKRNGNNDDDDHEVISGTSMATPHAVSAVAILKGYNKDLTFENVFNILKDNAIDLGEKGWDKYYGNGLISFKDVNFCDGSYCDELGIYKDSNKNISSIEAPELIFTRYNYYSTTNIMGSKVIVHYTDNTSEEKLLGELPNVEILNYDPTASDSQTVTIKVDTLTTDIQVTNPTNYEMGWEYNVLSNGKIEITGYKNHNLGIKKLYVPETIDSKQVVAFADNFKFAETGSDIESYNYLYVSSNFARFGNYSLAGTNIKYVYGANNKIEIGSHAFENSKIVSIDALITKIEDYAFKDCFELISIKTWEENPWYEVLSIGKYAFYNCKKLATIKMLTDFSNHSIGDVGDYAFYNCVSLAYFDLTPESNIGDYAFYETHLLTDIDLYQSDSIGKYAFHGSGISEAKFSINLEKINESAFENCKNLKTVSFVGGRIESKAFWNSGVETFDISSKLEYISEDAFAYTPMKRCEGISEGGKYKSVSQLGIVESSTNKLIVGFTDNTGASNTDIPDYITEVGDYAFTGNNNLKKIIIPATVTKIGVHAFEDCYQLSDVYMLGNTITFGNDTFKRSFEGDIQEENLKIYVHKDSSIKQFVKSKNLNYRHIEPDEMVVSNYEKKYKALSQVDFRNLEVKLIYYEEKTREEILNIMDYKKIAPLSKGVGFAVYYQTEGAYNFQYGDSSFIVEAKNEVGYLTEKNIGVTVEKATPTYIIPIGLTADFGQKLSEIILPEHFEWMDKDQIITGSGEAVYKAKYVPDDMKNYEIVENIDITITVTNSKTIIDPKIVVENKIYDGTTDIPISNIIISNLESSEYSIVSALSSSTNVGKEKATIVLRLSNEKFKDYAFSNGQQEKKFIIDFEIQKASINIKDTSRDITKKYDGNPHSVEINLDCDQEFTIKYMDLNGEYTLDKAPTYINVGTYVIKYKAYINNNYTEYFGQKTLTIEDEVPYIINKYSVDEQNKYIDLIDINTTVDDFKKNIKVNDGYRVEIDYKSVNGKNLLYTGGKTKIYKGDDLQVEYTNIVRGDVNGNAIIDIIDYIRIMKDIMDTTKLTGIYIKAADVNQNNVVDIIDYIRIMKMIMEEN